MAERIVNEKIEFAYVAHNIVLQLKQELENRFLYQQILVVDCKYEYGRRLEKMQNEINCNFKVVRNLSEINQPNNYACVIDINCNDLQSTKHFCKKHQLPFVVVLTKVVEPSCFCGEYISNSCKIENSNFPLGILLDKDEVFNKKNFVCSFLLELFGTSFDEMQDKVDNILFDANLDVEKNSELAMFRKEVLQVFQEKQLNLQSMFDLFSEYYIMLCLKKSCQRISLIDKLNYIYSKCQSNKNTVQNRLIFRLVLTSLMLNFFKYWNINLKSTINYQKHVEFLSDNKFNYNFKSLVLPEQKLCFVLQEFRDKFIGYAQTEQRQFEMLKNIIADIDVSFLYAIFNRDYGKNITNAICVESDIFDSKDILSLMNSIGLLNFSL